MRNTNWFIFSFFAYKNCFLLLLNFFSLIIYLSQWVDIMLYVFACTSLFKYNLIFNSNKCPYISILLNKILIFTRFYIAWLQEMYDIYLLPYCLTFFVFDYYVFLFVSSWNYIKRFHLLIYSLYVVLQIYEFQAWYCF